MYFLKRINNDSGKLVKSKSRWCKNKFNIVKTYNDMGKEKRKHVWL